MQGYEKVSVRGVREHDEALLFALAGEAYGDQLPAGETVAVLTRAQVFVAEAADGEIAGYVALVDEGVDLCIRQLLVAPSHVDRRVEQQLCEWAEGYAVSRHFDRVRVDVGEDELRERIFYQRRGYVATRAGGLELALPAPDE